MTVPSLTRWLIPDFNVPLRSSRIALSSSRRREADWSSRRNYDPDPRRRSVEKDERWNAPRRHLDLDLEHSSQFCIEPSNFLEFPLAKHTSIPSSDERAIFKRNILFIWDMNIKRPLKWRFINLNSKLILIFRAPTLPGTEFGFKWKVSRVNEAS